MLYKLKGKRVEKGYTQAELAKKLNISTYAYNQKENGLSDFRMGEINTILELLECNYEDIFLYK